MHDQLRACGAASDERDNMTEIKSARAGRARAGRATTGHLFFLDASGGRVLSVSPDGTGRKALVTDCRIPDGIAVDVDAGHIYWTNMGVPSQDDGSIER